jgi:crotonobetainyl-CoA:carnitine CoA-transferase CaiB-like acyl-CoA transferase
VLSLRESAAHPHLAARGSYVEVDGVVQSAPAPRFSVTPCAIPTPPREADNDAALAAWLVPEEISKLRESGVIS